MLEVPKLPQGKGGPMRRRIVLGFAGTQRGMTRRQECRLLALLSEAPLVSVEAVRHGDAVGADAQMHAMAQHMGKRILVHPCDIESQRAWCKGAAYVAEPKHPLTRNKDIIDGSDVVLAMPATRHEVQQSGTWAAIRGVRRGNQKLLIIWPDGQFVWEN